MRVVRVACQRLHRQLLSHSSFAAEHLTARSSCSLSAMDALAHILGPITPAHGLLGEQGLLKVPLSATLAVAAAVAPPPVVDSRPAEAQLSNGSVASIQHDVMLLNTPPILPPGYLRNRMLLEHLHVLLLLVPSLQALLEHSLQPTSPTQLCRPDAAAFRPAQHPWHMPAHMG